MSHIFETATDGVSIDRRLLNTGTKVVVSTRDRRKIADSAIADELVDLGPGILLSGLADLSAGTTPDDVVATITPGFAGKVVATFVIDGVAATTTADVDFVAEIDGTPVDGGGFKLTDAMLGTIGNLVPGAMIADTPNAEFSATDDITFVVETAGTAFTEGDALFGVLVAPIRKDGAAAL